MDILSWHGMCCRVVGLSERKPFIQTSMHKRSYPMKQIAQQIRTQLMTLITAGVAGLTLATVATAAEVGAGANAQAGGVADAHMSPSGSANGNAQWQSGATQGADRAADRMSTYGAEMKQSGRANLDATSPAKGKR